MGKERIVGVQEDLGEVARLVGGACGVRMARGWMTLLGKERFGKLEGWGEVVRLVGVAGRGWRAL